MNDVFEDLEKTLMVLREIVTELPKRYQSNHAGIYRCDEEVNDLLHYMELCDLNGAEGYKAYKDTQVVKQERRKMKDENDLIYPALEILKEFSKQEKKLNKAIGHIRTMKEQKENRTYKTRVRHELSERINKANQKMEVVS